MNPEEKLAFIEELAKLCRGTSFAYSYFANEAKHFGLSTEEASRISMVASAIDHLHLSMIMNRKEIPLH